MRICLVLSTLVFACGAQAASIAPVPPDPLELATGALNTVTTPEQRSAVITLLNRATNNYAMHARMSPPHVIEISFSATASTLFPAANGTLRETWISGLNWRWDATLGAYSLTRISSNGIPYDQQTPRPIPLRLKMLSMAVFNPVQAGAPRQETIRTFTADWKGATITCMLLSGPFQHELPASGRDWSEREYCIDPSTGLLQVASEAPGIYVAYDYANALHFHGQTLPSGVMVTEGGKTVLQAQVTSVTDTDGSNMTPFTVTSQMVSQGPAVVLNAPSRSQMSRASAALSPGSAVEPVIVHAIVDQQGHVEESELLQTTGLSEQALALVNGQQFGELPAQPGAPQRQREMFIEVRFHPMAAVSAVNRGPAN